MELVDKFVGAAAEFGGDVGAPALEGVQEEPLDGLVHLSGRGRGPNDVLGNRIRLRGILGVKERGEDGIKDGLRESVGFFEHGDEDGDDGFADLGGVFVFGEVEEGPHVGEGHGLILEVEEEEAALDLGKGRQGAEGDGEVRIGAVADVLAEGREDELEDARELGVREGGVGGVEAEDVDQARGQIDPGGGVLWYEEREVR